MTGLPIACVGGVGVGVVFTASRMPEPGETVIDATVDWVVGGKSSNHALGVAALGAEVRLISVLGDDHLAVIARDTWRRHGVPDGAVATLPGSSMLGAVHVDRDGENRIVVAQGVLADFAAPHVEAHRSKITSARILIAGTEGPVEPVVTAVAIARAARVPVVINPAPAPAHSVDELLAGADVVTPNVHEAAELAGGAAPPERMAGRIRDRGARAVVITLGADGALIADGDGCRHVSAAPVERIVDTTGAGDGFTAALGWALAGGATLAAAVAFASRAAALVVQAPGFLGGIASWNELRIDQSVKTS
jgi:ribokinase